VPLRAGPLLAQQVDGGGSDAEFSTWLVHDNADGPAIGIIGWGRGPRGRCYFDGRLDSWADGRIVQAPTPEACLRKLARAEVARGTGVSA
jgi:hypothetical protein